MTGHVSIPKCASAYILRFFLLCYHRVSMVFSVHQTDWWLNWYQFGSLGYIIELLRKNREFEVKIFAHVSGFEYSLSLLPVCYHGTGRIILASTVTSRAQVCQITVTGGLPLHLAISSSRKHLMFSLWPLYFSTRLNYCLFTWIFY
jgi:hypothetical protein